MYRPCCFFLLAYALLTPAAAQQPFTCDGRIYRVVEEQGGTTFQELSIDDAAQTVSVENRAFFGGNRINAIGYRPNDNLIYGLILGDPYVLCRIDADFQLTPLQTLALPPELLFVSGDISPGGRYFTVLGFTPESSDNLLALIDLEDPAFGLDVVPISKTNPEARLYCADIALHPTLDVFFGYEHSEGRLITLDAGTGLVDNTSYPLQPDIQGNVPSLFFDADGRLYGAGAPENVFTNRNLYRFDTDTGVGEIFETLGFERNQDACSCPFKVEVLKRVSSRAAFPCTLLDFEFTLINRTDRLQSGLRFTDTFPEGTLIQHLGELPFPASVNSALGSQVLTLDNIELPVGTFTFELTLAILEGAAEQAVLNTAYLDGAVLNPLEGPIRRPSDDPMTPEPDDPTFFQIRPLRVDFDSILPVLCPGGRLELFSGIQNAASYQWSNGSTGESITVTEPGTYAVTVQTPCAEAGGSIAITEDDIQVDLGPDREIERGATIAWQPSIQSQSPIRLHLWAEEPDTTLSCYVCPNPISQPLSDAVYQLIVENAAGCRDTSRAKVKVKGLKVYGPTAFSPNGNGINDVFYLQSRTQRPIRKWQVYDRWGGLAFEASNIETNDSGSGWDGQIGEKPGQTGPYVWYAQVMGKDGREELFKGMVYLLR